jgi:hypothetical protein
MRQRLAKATSIIFFILAGFGIANAQPYRRLTTEDFQGQPKHDGDRVAETACAISMRYDVHARDNHYQLTFYVMLDVDRQKSWLDRFTVNTPEKLIEILKHEQGHYTISYMEQQELLRTFDRTRFDDNYRAEVNEIFERIHAKYQQLNRDYDDDTRHSRNLVQQASWDKYFKRRLAYMPPMSD